MQQPYPEKPPQQRPQPPPALPQAPPQGGYPPQQPYPPPQAHPQQQYGSYPQQTYGYPPQNSQFAPPQQVVGVPLESQHVAVQPMQQEAYDCILCEKRPPRGGQESLPYKKSMKLKVSAGNDEERCQECGNKVASGGVYFHCEIVISQTHDDDGDVHTTKCHRRVCRECVNLSRDLREHSRFNHNSPAWKSSLCGCHGYAGLTLWSLFSYYHPFFGGGRALVLDFPTPMGEDSCPGSTCQCIFGILFIPHWILLDILGCTACAIHNNQKLLQERFGVEPRPCAEVFFCRWFSVARNRREASLRGYLHPIPFCGPSLEERKNAVHGPEPGVPRQAGNVYQTPQPVFAPPMPPPMMGHQQPVTFAGPPSQQPQGSAPPPLY